MKKRSLSMALCATTVIIIGGLLVSCGNDSTKGKIEGQEGNSAVNSDVVSKVEEEKISKKEKIDFSKYSDEDLVNFANNTTERFIGSFEEQMQPREVKKFKEYYYEELVGSQGSIEKRKAFIEEFYAPGAFPEEYVQENGKDYIKKYYYEDSIPYAFSGVKSREVIDDNTLKVTFNVSLYNGYPVVGKNIKTIEFTEINGELRAKTLLEDRSMYNVIENPNEEKPNLDNAQKEMMNYVNKELSNILRDDQIITGISERKYDGSTDSIYYGIIVTEPTQSSVIYYLNMKNGAIYGHYEKKIVVQAKK